MKKQKNKIDKRCCGKLLNENDIASNRFGILMCKECDDKNPSPFMAVYEWGNLKESGHFCGEVLK